MVKKGDRKLYPISGKSVVKTYEIKLGQQPVGDKKYEGDGKTPEGVYFIDRFNPNSRYYLSVGISTPSAQDVAEAAALGLPPGGDIFIHGLGREGRVHRSCARTGPPVASPSPTTRSRKSSPCCARACRSSSIRKRQYP